MLVDPMHKYIQMQAFAQSNNIYDDVRPEMHRRYDTASCTLFYVGFSSFMRRGRRITSLTLKYIKTGVICVHMLDRKLNS